MQRMRKHMYMDAVQSVSHPLTALCVRVCVFVSETPSRCRAFFFSPFFPFFAQTAGFGNHLTSVTSCYVSPSRRGRRGGRSGGRRSNVSRNLYHQRFFLSDLVHLVLSQTRALFSSCLYSWIRAFLGAGADRRVRVTCQWRLGFFFGRKETNPELIHRAGTRVHVGETSAYVKRASVFFSARPCHSAATVPLHPPPPPPLLKGRASSPCHLRFIHS